MRFPGATRLVMLFEERRDGERVCEVLGKQLEKYGLTLHESKTRYVYMRAEEDGKFDFLGFTHIWGWSKRGNRVLRRITAKDRYTRAVRAVNEWCKRNRHLRIDTQATCLGRVIRGHCNYYGVTGNGKKRAKKMTDTKDSNPESAPSVTVPERAHPLSSSSGSPR